MTSLSSAILGLRQTQVGDIYCFNNITYLFRRRHRSTSDRSTASLPCDLDGSSDRSGQYASEKQRIRYGTPAALNSTSRTILKNGNIVYVEL